MIYSSVFRIFLLLGSLATILSACHATSCTTLRQRDAVITSDYQEAKTQFENGLLAPQQYLKTLRDLRQREVKLFKQARACEKKLTDPEEYNYWFRGRLKFPGSLQMDLKRLEEGEN